MNTFDDGSLLRIVPLGGLGHIGGNMMVYENAQDMIVLDVGVLFPTSEQHGVDYVIPDVSYIVARKHKLRGYVLTHGHEDHIGALPWVLPQANAPMFATPFTEALIRNKLAEFPDIRADIRPMRDRQRFSLGSFALEPLAVTHSIPHAVALGIEMPGARVVHTGDFKIDPDPVDGRHTDLEGLARLGQAGVDVLLSDSTNAEKDGHTWGEREVATTLARLVKESPGRLFLTTFASHIDRIQAVFTAAAQADRTVVAVGRSMVQNIEMSLERGFLRADGARLATADAFTSLPANRVVVLASGSQGEPQSAMARIAAGRYPPIEVSRGDRCILSSRRIPGNELHIGDMINSLIRQGADVIGDHDARVHSSGHGFNDEQREVIGLCRPRFFVPLHGELRHMVRHARVAVDAGVAADNAMVVEDGHPLALRREGDTVTLTREARVPAGLVFVDGKGVGDVGEVVLRDRKILSESGIVCCVVAYDSQGRLAGEPQLATRGVVHVDVHRDLLGRAIETVANNLAADAPRTSTDRADSVRSALRRFFRRELGRRPLIVPIVLDLPHCCCD